MFKTNFFKQNFVNVLILSKARLLSARNFQF